MTDFNYFVYQYLECGCKRQILIFRVLALGPENFSDGRASDCSSEGCRFEAGLVDIETLLTQLVECQPHELKAVGSIPT